MALPESFQVGTGRMRWFEDIQDQLGVLLTLGPSIHHDPVLMYKILRVMKNKQGRNQAPYFDFLTIMDEVILPAVCFLHANCSLSEEIWDVLMFYPNHHRFRLYRSGKGDTIVMLHPSLIKKRVDAVKKVKHLMRRISKENVKPAHGTLAREIVTLDADDYF